jgi:hypothetical protein
MRVKLVSDMSGLRNGEPWPGPGEVVDLTEDEANNMLINGTAVMPDQKHAADARFAAKQAADKKAEVDRKAGIEKAKADAKAAIDKAAAEQKALDDQAAADKKAAKVGA